MFMIEQTRSGLELQQGATSADNSVLGHLAGMVVKIASTEEEVGAALRLRQLVFTANQTAECGAFEPDEDQFDRHCDHLIVKCLDQRESDSQVVATYRLLGQERSREIGGFYSENEFGIQPLLARHPDKRFLEFGRSCVLPEYRSKRTIELLWHGSWAYVQKYGYDVMFGCASFEGTDPDKCRGGLNFLATHAAPENSWQVEGIGEVVHAETAQDISLKSALKDLPPLIKGYLRLGAMFSNQAVVDHDFGTIDVLVMLPLERLNPRYVRYYGAGAERHA